MLTIFTIPKPFIGLDDIHQRNAILSWLAIRPECEIILCGNDQGVAEAAREFGVLHIANIPVNEFGTPYLDAAFQRAQQIAKHDLMCYVNADIIFFDDLVDAVRHIPFEKFLVVGRRWDTNVDQQIEFHDLDRRQSFKEAALRTARLNYPLGSDYFQFKRNSLGILPSFLVGRPNWDNWMIYNARAKRLPVIDASYAIIDIHQNHDYSHVPAGIKNTWYGPEADENHAFVGNEKHFTLWDCSHVFDQSYNLKKVRGDRYLKRQIQTIEILNPRSGFRQKLQACLIKILMAMYYRRKWIPSPILELTLVVASRLI